MSLFGINPMKRTQLSHNHHLEKFFSRVRKDSTLPVEKKRKSCNAAKGQIRRNSRKPNKIKMIKLVELEKRKYPLFNEHAFDSNNLMRIFYYNVKIGSRLRRRLKKRCQVSHLATLMLSFSVVTHETRENMHIICR